jgi:hypothetical protein
MQYGAEKLPQQLLFQFIKGYVPAASGGLFDREFAVTGEAAAFAGGINAPEAIPAVTDRRRNCVH